MRIRHTYLTVMLAVGVRRSGVHSCRRTTGCGRLYFSGGGHPPHPVLAG